MWETIQLVLACEDGDVATPEVMQRRAKVPIVTTY